MGSLDENEMICELKSHIYVMPSHIENSPNNLCEAMILECLVLLHAGGTASMMSNKKRVS